MKQRPRRPRRRAFVRDPVRCPRRGRAEGYRTLSRRVARRERARVLRRHPAVRHGSGQHSGGGEAGQSAPGDGRRPGAQFDGRDGRPPLRQGHGCLAGATADLDHPVSGGEPGTADQVIEHLRRADRPGAVVHLGRLVEHRTQTMTLSAVVHDAQPRKGRSRITTILPHRAASESHSCDLGALAATCAIRGNSTFITRLVGRSKLPKGLPSPKIAGSGTDGRGRRGRRT